MNKEDILGCVLAGGRSTRMEGGEKTLMQLGGIAMVSRILQRLQKQVPDCIINANGNSVRFFGVNVPIVPDRIEGFAGPLAGIHAAMTWAITNRKDAEYILTVAGDTPFFPGDLRTRFLEAVKGKKDALAMAYSDGNRHPTFGLWPVSLCRELGEFLEAGDRKVMLFAQRYNLVKVDFPLTHIRAEPFDPFFNVNTPEDFAKAERILEEQQP